MNFNPALDDVLMRIGKKLYQIRHIRNEKLTTVANGVKMSHAVISRVENGRYQSLSLDLLATITGYYKITIDDVLMPFETNHYESTDPKTALIEYLITENKTLKDRITAGVV